MVKKKPKKPPKAPKPLFDPRRLAVLGIEVADPALVLARLQGLGLAEADAAALVGMELAQFLALLEREEYSRAWQHGVRMLDAAVTNALLASAIAGDVVAQKFWLVNRLPEVFSTRGKSKPPSLDGEHEPAASPLGDLRICG